VVAPDALAPGVFLRAQSIIVRQNVTVTSDITVEKQNRARRPPRQKRLRDELEAHERAGRPEVARFTFRTEKEAERDQRAGTRRAPPAA